MNDEQEILDWTTGERGLAFQDCGVCASRWAFQRRFCPRCGSNHLAMRQASGRGRVEAVTTIHRAPTEALKSRVPYHIALVMLEEGIRVMGRGGAGLSIGTRVHALFIEEGGQILPCFEADLAA